jgi:hypothetical protein
MLLFQKYCEHFKGVLNMKTTIATLMILAALAGTTVFGNEKSKKMMTMTTEQRQGMATAHDKMAACMRSDKEMSECHKEMKESCMDVMGKDGCWMMKDMDKMHHMKK